MDTEMKNFFVAFEERLNEKFLRIDERFFGIEGRFDELGQRMHELDQRVSGLDQRVSGLDQKVSGLNQRIDRLEQNQHDMQEQISYLVDHFGKFEDDMRTLLRSHDVRLTHLEARVQFA